MKNTFLHSKSLNSEGFSHIISVNPVAIFSLPDYVLISGDKNPTLREKAIEWYKLFENNELPTPRLIPKGYQWALDKVRANRNIIDLAALAMEIGVSEKILTLCLNGEVFGGKTVHLSFRERVKLVELVKNNALIQKSDLI